MSRLATIFAILLLTCAIWPSQAEARVRLEYICSVQGQQEVRLTGLGMIVGLPGTGDGAKNAPTVRALRAAMARLNQPVLDTEIRNADNVAIVMVEATIPRTGLKRGQKIDCFVNAVMGAKSLRGGRLLSTPLTTADARNQLVIGVAGGAIVVDDPARPTSARITQGVDLVQDVTALFLSKQQDLVTLLIDPAHASFWTASEVARVINSEFTFESAAKTIAKPTGPGSVEIQIPQQYRQNPVEFIAQVLESGIDTPNTQARVILNPRTGTVVVTGEVEISPVIISHKSFVVEIGADDPLLTRPGPFIGLIENSGRQSPQQLKDLVDALNKLRVPTADVIDIIRELHATGKLHAELIEK